MSPCESPVIEASDLSFRYSGRSAVWEHVSFTLCPGETAILVGVNGAGKSTLLRALAGWTPIDAGEVRFLGKPMRGHDRGFRRELVLVNDTPPFYDDLTAAEHVRFVLRVNRLRDREPAATALLDRFGLTAQAGAYPSSFSRGMRYKLALVMALALEPALLLLDEPYGPLDPRSADVLTAELAGAAARGAAVLLSGHQIPPGLHPDRFYELSDGSMRSVPTNPFAQEPA